ncbi:MAG TPA: mechanosensitive ion channel domain-containing protein [Gemmatimonadaceae bacterium]|nr:mechanosensitive ion channel domain-containing protein [Gemmatimonadaceae bacterium]
MKDFLRAIESAGALPAQAHNVTQFGFGDSAGSKFLLTVVIAAAAMVVGALGHRIARASLTRGNSGRTFFWIDQAIKLGALTAFVIAGVLIWSDDLASLGGALGVIGAGVAVALQRVITSFAGYLIILRGNLFSIGDRITFGGVRGDVIGLGFMRTTVLEMGQSPPEKAEDPATWVRGRQYTGRVVHVTNDKIFDFPVYNYTREFPFVWDEIVVPVNHDAEIHRAEAILLEAARAHASEIIRDAQPALADLRKTFFVKGEIELEPRVYITVSDNYVELSLRFLSREPGVRPLKDALYREILARLHEAHIAIASTSMAIDVRSPLAVRLNPAE